MIVEEGIRRMYVDQDCVFYYLTVMNEPYAMPAMPEGARDGILKGIYRYRATSLPQARARAQLLGSGAILPEVVKAQEALETAHGVGADVWSVTSYSELYRDGHACERWNLLHPVEAPRIPYVTTCLANEPGVFIAASDYVKALPDSIDKWLPRPLTALGTDGYGRSAGRAALRDHFELDSRYIIVSALAALAREGTLDRPVVQEAIRAYGIDPEKSNPAIA